MTCLHLHPKDLQIPDWEMQQDIVVVVCHDCGKVLEIQLLSSQSQAYPNQALEVPAARPLNIIY